MRVGRPQPGEEKTNGDQGAGPPVVEERDGFARKIFMR